MEAVSSKVMIVERCMIIQVKISASLHFFLIEMNKSVYLVSQAVRFVLIYFD